MYNKIRRDLLLALLRSRTVLASCSNTPDSQGELSGEDEDEGKDQCGGFYLSLYQDHCE